MESIVISEKDRYSSSVKKEKDTGLKIRNSELNDLSSIMDILADGRSYLASLGIEQWQGYYPQEEMISSDIMRGESFVVEDGSGNVVATAMLGLEGEKDYLNIENGRWLTEGTQSSIPYAVIHRVAVSKQTRGTGVADFLITELEKTALNQGKASIRVDTHPSNSPMRGLLTKHGYSECGIVLISHAEEYDPQRVAYEKVL